MSTSATPSNPNRPGDDRNLVPVDPSTAVGFEDKLDLFWKKYRNVVIGFCVLGVVVIVGKGGWEYFERQAELKIEKDYAAATTADQQKAFAAAHPNHSLAGLVYLAQGDEAYKANKPADALAAYEKAVAVLKNDVPPRVKLGIPAAKVQLGKTPEAITDFKKLADDAGEFKAVRTEAAYQLASLAAAAGNAADVQKYTDQLMQIDPSSQWTQRGLSLRASLPAQPAEAAAPAPADAGQKKDAGAKKDDAAKKDEGSKKIEVKLPGK